jgi:hypothetical protein
MATRNLSRTIIEGGRHHQSSADRKFRNRRRRRVRFDDHGDPIGRDPDPGLACLYHHDRLGPLTRWLRRQTGRPWNKVYQELSERYDARALKGWHLRGHLQSEVERTPDDTRWGRRTFRVDAHGLLRENREPSRGHVSQAQRLLEAQAAGAWARDRRVIVHGQALFWTADRVDAADKKPFVSRQGVRLTDEEAEYWNGLLDATRTALTYVAGGRLPARARSRGPS